MPSYEINRAISDEFRTVIDALDDLDRAAAHVAGDGYDMTDEELRACGQRVAAAFVAWSSRLTEGRIIEIDDQVDDFIGDLVGKLWDTQSERARTGSRAEARADAIYQTRMGVL